jgi:hypothetical protein
MELLIAMSAPVVLLVASAILHYQAMMLTRGALSRSGLHRHAGALLGMIAVLLAQLLSVLIYAVAYLALEQIGMGSLDGELEGGFIDYFYFSLMSYTTLGVGDVYPTGGLRVISGIEALNGFALIGWTASFAYALMKNGWE